jgi:hypothetical protein
MKQVLISAKSISSWKSPDYDQRSAKPIEAEDPRFGYRIRLTKLTKQGGDARGPFSFSAFPYDLKFVWL